MWVSLGSPTIAELMVQEGCDAILFDLQHGLWTRPTLEAAIGMTRGKAVPLVRPQDDSYFAIGNALDSGALGLIVPMVESAEQAKRIVAAAKYPPEGRRSFGGIRPALDWKQVVPKTNAAIFVAVMIETKAGVGERRRDRGRARHRHAVHRARPTCRSPPARSRISARTTKRRCSRCCRPRRRPARAAACSRRTSRWRRTGGCKGFQFVGAHL